MNFRTWFAFPLRVWMLAATLAVGVIFSAKPAVAADLPGELPFLKVGGTYTLQSAAQGMPAIVKIVEAAGGAWYRVEYTLYVAAGPIDSATGVQPTKSVRRQMWINFAMVSGVQETETAMKELPPPR